MAKSKAEMRKQIEQGMTAFLSNGGTVKEVPMQQKKVRKPKEEMVEIELDNLPPQLREKYFPGQ